MTAPLRVAFCVSGGGHLCRAAIRHATLIGIAPSVVIAESKAQADLEEFGRANGVRVVRLPSGPREAFAEALERAYGEADAGLFALTFDRLLSDALVGRYRGKIVNLHPGLLPAFAGTRPMERALAGGVRFAGATVHEVDEGVDTGAVIAQAVAGLHRDETRETLGARLFALMKPMYLQVLAWYAQGRVQRNGDGQLLVAGATYGTLPISPAIELQFPE